MKTLALATAAAFISFTLSAVDKAPPGAGNLRELLQQGLFEEEANRNTAKAAAAYADLVTQYDTQRAFAATALFRLAEIKAKEGNKAEAIALHQRLLTEFPKDEALAKRSSARLAELGGALPVAAVVQADAPTDAEAQELANLREIVKNSPDLLNAVGEPEFMTPLGKAAKNGWLSAASFLLDQGADPNGGDGQPLRVAAEQGHKRMVELLLQRGADRELNLALYVASANSRLEVARVLLAHGANPNVISYFGTSNGPSPYGTPLIAAVSTANEPLADLLLEYKADPNLLNREGESPLIAAIWRKNEEALITGLLAQGANVNSVLGDGRTVLHRAAQVRPPIVPLLLKHGASAKAEVTKPDPGYESKTIHSEILPPVPGQTPLHFAMMAFQPEQVPGLGVASSAMKEADLKELFKLWESLLAKGADINAPDTKGITPLHLAAGRSDLPVDALVWLVEHGANLEAEDQNKQSVLETAQQVGFERRLELETRFRFPQWTKERAVKALNLCRGGFSQRLLTFGAPDEAAGPPTVRDSLVRIFENSTANTPTQFNLRIYRAEKSGLVALLSKIPFTKGLGFPELPALHWGDVLVLECGEANDPRGRIINRPSGLTNESTLEWLRSAPADKKDEPAADSSAASHSATDSTSESR